MQAVILAEWEGVRIRPLTDTTPKPLLRIAGVPLIQYTIELFEQHGIKDIIVCTSYRRDMIREALGDGSQLGVKLRYSESEQPSGTGGALKKAAWMLDPTEKFFVANADEIREADLYAMRRLHEDSGADATMALVQSDDVRQLSRARLEGNRIKEFVEKPKSDFPVPGLASAGLYLFQPRVLELISNIGSPMLEKSVFPKMALRGRLYGFVSRGRWLAIDSLEQYHAAERAIRS
jgi:mannose-1-phosphate guanylyltransferase